MLDNMKSIPGGKETKFHIELERAIEQCKAKIFQSCAIMPDRLALPFKLYFKLVCSLGVSFEGSWLKEYCGLKVELHWVNLNEFRVFKADMIKDYLL